MGVPFAIDIAGPLAEGMRLGLAQRQAQQDAVFRTMAFEEAHARLRAQLDQERVMNEHRDRVWKQQQDDRARNDLEREAAGRFYDSLAMQFGLLGAPSLNGEAAALGINAHGPDEQAAALDNWFTNEPEPRGPQQVDPAAWMQLPPQMKSQFLQPHIKQAAEDQASQAEWSSIERAMRKRGHGESDILATHLDWQRRRGGLPVSRPMSEYEQSRMQQQVVPELGTPEYQGAVESLMRQYPQVFGDMQDASDYLELKRARLANQMRAPGAGQVRYDPEKDPETKKYRRAIEDADYIWKRAVAALDRAEASDSVGADERIKAAQDRVDKALTAKRKAEDDYDRVVDSRGKPGVHDDRQEHPAKPADQDDKALAVAVFRHLQANLKRPPTREEFNRAMQAAKGQ